MGERLRDRLDLTVANEPGTDHLCTAAIAYLTAEVQDRQAVPMVGCVSMTLVTAKSIGSAGAGGVHIITPVRDRLGLDRRYGLGRESLRGSLNNEHRADHGEHTHRCQNFCAWPGGLFCQELAHWSQQGDNPCLHVFSD